MDALVTYGSSRFAYLALRSLTGMGLKVAVADTGKVGMGQWSKHCSRSYLYSDPVVHPERFVEDINRILGDCGARFLLPALYDAEVLAKYRDRLPGGVILPVAGYESIHKASDKGIAAAYAKEAGADVPEVIDWDGWGELEEKLRVMGSRVVVKLRRGHSSRWVLYPENQKDALAMCKGFAAKYSSSPGRLPMVQKRINGEGWGVGCLYHKGRMLASCTYRMLREKAFNGGTSTLRVSERDQGMENCAKRLLDGLSWHGLAGVEFKYDRELGRAWFIEINPYLWGAIGLAVAAGVDLFRLMYAAETEGPEEALKMVRPQRLGVVTRWWMGDAMRALAEAKRLRPLKALELLLPGGTDFYDDFRKDDLAASAGEIAHCLERYLRSGRRSREVSLMETV